MIEFCLQNMMMRMTAAEGRLAKVENNNGGSGNGTGGKQRPLMESKIISNLKELGSDRAGYKEWADKFKDGESELRDGAKDIPEWVEQLKGQDVTKEEYDKEGLDLSQDFKTFDRAIYICAAGQDKRPVKG